MQVALYKTLSQIYKKRTPFSLAINHEQHEQIDDDDTIIIITIKTGREREK
jgi:hypothetical protein